MHNLFVDGGLSLSHQIISSYAEQQLKHSRKNVASMTTISIALFGIISMKDKQNKKDKLNEGMSVISSMILLIGSVFTIIYSNFFPFLAFSWAYLHLIQVFIVFIIIFFYQFLWKSFPLFSVKDDNQKCLFCTQTLILHDISD